MRYQMKRRNRNYQRNVCAPKCHAHLNAPRHMAALAENIINESAYIFGFIHDNVNENQWGVRWRVGQTTLWGNL